MEATLPNRLIRPSLRLALTAGALLAGCAALAQPPSSPSTDWVCWQGDCGSAGGNDDGLGPDPNGLWHPSAHVIAPLIEEDVDVESPAYAACSTFVVDECNGGAKQFGNLYREECRVKRTNSPPCGFGPGGRTIRGFYCQDDDGSGRTVFHPPAATPSDENPPGTAKSGTGDSSCHALDPLKQPQCPLEGNPVCPAMGNKLQVERDVAGDGTPPLVFERFYNSGWATVEATLGPRWRHTYDRSVLLAGDGATAVVFRANRQGCRFRLDPGAWVADPDVTARL